MSARAWSTGSAPDPDFDRAWEGLVARLPFAHFGFRLDVLRWTHGLGTPSLLVMVEQAGWSGAIVARREGEGWVSGLPWRWQAAASGNGRDPERQLERDEAALLFDRLQRFTGGRRVRAHLPVAAPPGVPSYPSGRTLVQRIDMDDEALLKAMDKTKRAMIRRAERDGYEVFEAREREQFRAFAAVQRQTDRRHGRVPLDSPGDEPAPGERWREWELPWMWLLVADRDGEIGSGYGVALGPGCIVESRAAASTEAALRSGAFILLAREVARRARERGYGWLNWGGDTFFKRDMTQGIASHVQLHAWLGGGLAWRVANHGEALVHAARRRARSLFLSWRAASGREAE